MYEIEVYVPSKASITDLLRHKGKFETREGEILYNEKVIRLNLTGIWDLAVGDYDNFVDFLVGTILHEYLHYFFHVNEIPQDENVIGRLSDDLFIPALGRLVGAIGNEEEDVSQYKKCIRVRFGEKFNS